MTAFVLWMLLWPSLCDICRSYRIAVTGKERPDTVVGIAVLIEVAIWISVGVLVFPKGGAS